jgi:hypothetical protein
MRGPRGLFFLAPFVIVALFIVSARRYAMQSLDVEQVVRGEIIPQLERELSKDIEVGRIETDWFSRIRIHDIVVGRDRRNPLGALLQAKSAEIAIDPVGLALKRLTPLEAVQGITLDRPQIYVRRDERGRLNLMELVKKRSGPPGARWAGYLRTANGRIYAEDVSFRSATGRRLIADAHDVNVDLVLNGDGPANLKVLLPRTFLANEPQPIRNIALAGDIDVDGKWALANVTLPSISGPLLADYAFRRNEAVISQGTLGMRVQIGHDAAASVGAQWLARGTLSAQNISGYARAVREPNTNQALRIANLSGALRFDNSSVFTNGITVTALNSPWRLAGGVSLRDSLLVQTRQPIRPIFDMNVATTGADTARLLRLLPSNVARQIRLTAGRSRGNVRLRGGLNEPQIGGEWTLPNVQLQTTNAGRVRLASLSTRFQTRVELRNNRFAAANGHISLSTPGLTFAAAGSNARGGLLSTLEFSARQQNRALIARGKGTFALNNFAGGASTATARANSLRGNFNLSHNANRSEFVSNFGAQGLNFAAARNGNASAGNLRGTVRATLDGARTRGILSVRSSDFAANAPRLVSAQAGAFEAGLWFNGNPQNNLQVGTSAVLRGVTARSTQYGTARGDALQLAARSDRLALSRLSQARWSGAVSFDDLNIGNLNFARLSPQAAQQIQSVGAISGNARFTDLALAELSNRGRSRADALPEMSGQLRVANARIAENTVRDARATFALNNGVLRVRGAQAQSEAGALLADIETTLGGGPSSVSFSAPRLVLDAARINPYLASTGLQATGRVVGRLSVRNVGNALNAFQTEFDMQLPAGQVRTLDYSQRAPEANQRQLLAPNQTLQVNGARLRGSGLARLGDNNAVRFAGNTLITASSARVLSAGTRSTAPALPAWLSGSTIQNLSLQARGGVARTSRGIQPEVRGTIRLGRVVLPTLPSARGQSPLAAQGTQPVLTNITAEFDSQQPRGVQVQIPRVAMNIGSGRVDGHLTVRSNGGLGGQLLASKLNAGDLQRWIGNDFAAFSGTRRPTPTSPDVAVRGSLFARVDLAGTVSQPSADVQARLLNGSIGTRGATVPVDSARADVDLQWPLPRTIPVENFVVWSRGGRLAVNGEVTQQARTWNLDLNATVNGFRLRDIAAVPGLGQTVAGANIDGLTNADLRITGTTENPRVVGRTRLRLAQAFGMQIESAQSEVLYDGRNGRPLIQLTDLQGRIENSPFSGEVNADFAQNTWSAQLNTQEVASSRLIRIADELPTNNSEKISDLPLRGALTADINVSGQLRNAQGQFALKPQDGTVSLETTPLRWRGREIGTISADMVLEDQILQIAGLQLWGITRRPEDQQRREAGITTTESTNEIEAASLVRLTGAIPLSPNAPGLDARIVSEDARVSVLLQAVEEIGAFLQERGREVPGLDSALRSLDALPPGVQGRVALDARFRGTLAQPVVAVERLVVRDASFPYVGGQQMLPTLDAAFDYSPDENTVTIRKAEVLLAKAEAAKTENDEDDTVLRLFEGGRIQIGGAIDLQGELLHANLPQIATYVPSLREVNGRPIVGGDIAQFQFDVNGLLSAPTVSGSLVADRLAYRDNVIDKLRVSRFTIGDGQFAIEPGKLTIVKGAFQSSSAWGRIPWTWGNEDEAPGPRREAPMEVHFPLGSRDFGALAGVFVPAILSVDAEEFRGNLSVTGTLNEPAFGGELSIKEGRLRFDPALLPFDLGLTKLSGTVRFVNGNQLQIDQLDYVRGQVVPGLQVSASTTGNPTASERDPVAAARREKRRDLETDLGGEFTLRGGIDFNLAPEVLNTPNLTLAAHRYNLQFGVNNALFVSEDISGLRDVNLGVVWQTRGADPRLGQHVRWILTGQSGAPRRKNQEPGALYSYASVNLPPNLGAGAEALARAQFRPFDDISGFEELPVLQKLAALRNLPNVQAIASLPDPRSQFTLDDLVFNVRNVGRGTLGGALFFDNEPANTPTPGIAQPRPSLATLLQAARPTSVAVPTRERSKYFSDAPRVAQNTRPAPRRVQNGAPSDNAPMRVSGDIVVSQAQITGFPGGAEGGAPAQLPDFPLLDITASLGREVQITTPNLRAEITGAAEIGGTPDEPLIVGTFATRTGQIRFPNAVARLTTGEIALNVARDPVTKQLRTNATIDASARGQAGRYQITVALRGPLDLGTQNTQNLRVDVTSNPPLAQDEAFAQLFGTSVRGGDDGPLRSGQANEAYARAVLSLVSAPLFSGIERSIERLFGLSSVTFEYRFNEPLYVQIGQAIGDRIFVTYRRSLSSSRSPSGTGLGTTGTFFAPSNQTLRIEYRIKGDYQLSFQSDDFRKQLAIEKTWRF